MLTKLKLGAMTLLSLVPVTVFAQTVRTAPDSSAPSATVSGITPGGKSVAMPVDPCMILIGTNNSTPVPCTATNPLPVTIISGGGGGGGSSGGTATAASPTYTEAATGQALSLDLTGYQRVRTKQDGAWSVGITGTPTIANTSFGATQLGTWNITNISGAVSLPTGAATSAKQPALGTAGTPSIDVLTVQGSATGTALPVDTVIKATSTDRGTVVGTSAVTLMSSNTARRGFTVQNQSATATCYINGTATATADYHALMIAAGAYYETPPTHVGTGAISIICSAASTSVYAREW